MAWGIVQLPAQEEWSVYAKEAYYAGPASRIRRFVYRPNGLVALSAMTADQSAEGEAITRPIAFNGKSLLLNYRTARGGSIRVELQDAGGNPIPSFTIDDSLLRGNELRGKVTWKDRSDVSKLAGKAVRIRFVLQDAELFALQFE